MDATAKAIEVLKASLNELNSGLEGKTAALKKAKEDGYKAAEQTYKNAKADADRIFKDGMKQFDKEEKEVDSLVKALEALGVKSTTKTKIAKPKGERVPFPNTTLAEAKTNNVKVGVILKKLGTGTNEDILKALNKEGVLTKSGNPFTKKNVELATSALKRLKYITATGEKGEGGKADIFKFA